MPEDADFVTFSCCSSTFYVGDCHGGEGPCPGCNPESYAGEFNVLDYELGGEA